MPSRKSASALLTIRENIILALAFVESLDEVSFSTDRKAFYAATRCLEIISEASRHVPLEITARHPGIPWKRIADAANIYRHNYDNVVEAFVWVTIHESLPELLAVVEAELQSGDDGV